MPVTRSPDQVPAADSVVTVGVFDGVHLGHRALLARTRTRARESGMRAVAVTFDRHPLEVVRPANAPSYLQSLEDKVDALVAQGMDLVHVVAFDHKFSRLSAEAFVEGILAGPIQARQVLVGTNFRFGSDATGDVDVLAAHGRTFGFEVEAVALRSVEGVEVSSSRIRAYLDAGHLEWVTAALGRPHSLEGEVVKGDARGRTIGFPTANLAVDERLQRPGNGVYAGHATVTGRPKQRYPTVINVGTRPTFDGRTVTVEAHLLDVDLPLYGKRLTCTFAHRVRDERRFDSLAQLTTQIEADVVRARDLLAR